MAEGHGSGNTDQLLGVFDRLLNFLHIFFLSWTSLQRQILFVWLSACHKVAHDKL